jgi:hypothetical protein
MLRFWRILVKRMPGYRKANVFLPLSVWSDAGRAFDATRILNPSNFYLHDIA